MDKFVDMIEYAVLACFSSTGHVHKNILCFPSNMAKITPAGYFLKK
jgi:hypothetical protein